jgi:hypothetical protein
LPSAIGVDFLDFMGDIRIMNPVKYEYRVQPMEYLDAGPTTQDQQYLNEVGREGWELVAVMGPTPSLSTSQERRLWLRYYLKRRVE